MQVYAVIVQVLTAQHLKIFRMEYAALANENGAHNLDVTAALSALPRTMYARIFSSREKMKIRLVHIIQIPGEKASSRNLRVVMDESKVFFSVIDPDAMVLWEAGEQRDGIWFILTGSVHHRKHDLVSGDWIFIPKGKRCSVRVGQLGATACYCECLPPGEDVAAAR